MATYCPSRTAFGHLCLLLQIAALVHSSALRGHQALSSRQTRQLDGVDGDSANMGESSAVSFPDTGSRKRDPISQESLVKTAESSVKFTWDSYRALQIPPTENVFFSPYSVMNALGMLTLGSEGTTKDQLLDVLRLDPSLPSKDLHDAFLTENTKLQNDPSAIFAVANNFFVERTTVPNINPLYVNALSTFYNSSMDAVDFSSNPVSARKTVNDWVSQNTFGKIKEFLPANLDPNTQLILANAIYFNGTWSTKFPSEQTVEGPFRTSKGTTVRVPFMMLNTDLYYYYDEFLRAQTVIIPYTDFKYSMHVVVPDESQSLSSLEDTLNHLHLNKMDRATRLGQVVLKLPKLKMRQRIDLTDWLLRMNATDVFNPLKNDFSGIFLNTRPGFFVNKVIHEAVVEVNEEGTVAAAATGIIGTRVANNAGIVNLNRPFLFYIVDEYNGFVLFWGRVEDPSK